MLRKKKNVTNIISRAGAVVLGLTLTVAACTNEQGESRRALGTGDGTSIEESNYEMTEGHDSTTSGAAVTSALKADTAADEDGLVNNKVAEKFDTSESYSSINGRSSTSNTGASVSNGGGTTTGSLYSGRQQNQTPPEGSKMTTTGEKVPLKPTNDGETGASNVKRSQTGNEDRNGRPIQNGKAAPANESNNKSSQPQEQ